MVKLRNSPNLDFSKPTEAFPYQQEAIDTVVGLDYAAIFFEQGLGKTKIAIDLSLDWLKTNQVNTVVICTKKGLIRNWQHEFKVHSHLHPRIISSDRTANHRALFSASRVFITSYEAVAAVEEKLSRWTKHRAVAVILDESQKIKNPDSKLAQSFFRLSDCFKRRVIMTGTPMANRPYDIWSQIFFLDAGESLGTNFIKFKASVDLPKKGEEERFKEELRSVYPRIRQFAIRQTKEGSGLDLPDKEYRTIYSDWEPCQRDMYLRVRDELSIELLRNGKSKVDDTEAILKRLLRLSQITSNPILLNDSYRQKPGKLIETENLVSDILEKKEKVIIWTSFVDNCRYLGHHFKNFGTVQIHGSMPIVNRDKSVQKFLHHSDINILVATPAAAKEGLTLTAANHVIFFDRSFSLDDYLQAQDRIHRISQIKTCYVNNIVMRDSIDEWVSSLIQLKHTAVKAGMGEHIEEELEQVLDIDLSSILNKILNEH